MDSAPWTTQSKYAILALVGSVISLLLIGLFVLWIFRTFTYLSGDEKTFDDSRRLGLAWFVGLMMSFSAVIIAFGYVARTTFSTILTTLSLALFLGVGIYLIRFLTTDSPTYTQDFPEELTSVLIFSPITAYIILILSISQFNEKFDFSVNLYKNIKNMITS